MTHNAQYIATNLEAIEELSKLLEERGRDLGLAHYEALKDLVGELPEVARDLATGCELMTELIVRLRPMTGGSRDLEPLDADPLPIILYATSVCRDIAVQAHADLVYDGPKSLPMVAIDPTELTQTLINLVSNATQSLLGLKRERARVVVHAEDAGDAVCIVVTDNGRGIAREDVGKVGTPFFSTRPKGTGLGVAQSRRFVEKARGRLTVESEQGRGTSVTISLPKASRERQAPRG
jgi:signal transduction histidine kinase